MPAKPRSAKPAASSSGLYRCDGCVGYGSSSNGGMTCAPRRTSSASASSDGNRQSTNRVSVRSTAVRPSSTVRPCTVSPASEPFARWTASSSTDSTSSGVLSPSKGPNSGRSGSCEVGTGPLCWLSCSRPVAEWTARPRWLNTTMQNLLPEPPATLLPADAAAGPLADAALADTDEAYQKVAGQYPTSSAAWGALARRALAAGAPVTAYAYARTGYHRGLDQLRRNGWKGFGPVPYAHEHNRGFLRCVAVLARAAQSIGETDEFQRCLDLLDDCDPAARSQLGLS